MIVRLDKQAPVVLGATPIDVRPDGYRVYRGTATYGDVALDYPEFGGAEFRPASEVMSPEAVASMIGVPFTIHHPDDLLSADDEDAIRRHQVGTVLAARVNPKVSPPALEVDVIVHQRSAQRAVESGELAELSPGYRCEDEKAPPGARHAGRPYQTIQRRHRYNHLSGVLNARTVLPDGRRARLDEMPVAGAAYPRAENTSMTVETTANDTTDTTSDGARKDAKTCDAADPAIVLAKFSPEDAAILKTLSPEGMIILAEMGAMIAGEAAEEALEGEAPPPELPVAEVAEVDAGAAPPAVTMDMVNAAIADGIKKALMEMGSAKKDAAAPFAQPVVAKVDAEAIIARAAEQAAVRARTDAALVESVRQDGHRVVGYDDAVATMLAVIEQHTPKHLPRAREDLKAGRMDALRTSYAAAEDVRRKDALDAQESMLRPILDSSGDGQRAAAADVFRMPTRGGSGSNSNASAQ